MLEYSTLIKRLIQNNNQIQNSHFTDPSRPKLGSSNFVKIKILYFNEIQVSDPLRKVGAKMAQDFPYFWHLPSVLLKNISFVKMKR